MIKIPKFKITLLFSVFYFIFSVFPANAAIFSVNPQELVVNKDAAIVLSLDTEDQEINAVELRLKFSPDDFLIKDIMNGNSIINFWVEKPSFSNEKSELAFSGIIPGGFRGVSGQLLKIILFPKRSGEIGFEISEAKTLLNDGKGTATEIKTSNLKFNIKEDGLPQEEVLLPVKDINPPEDFTPQTASDPNIFGGKYFLVFATQDKISGIAGYFVYESAQKKEAAQISAKEWIEVESPYLLKDQELKSYIYVKAIDKMGNQRVVTVAPEKSPAPARWYENYWVYVIIMLVLIAGYAIWKLCKQKKIIHG